MIKPEDLVADVVGDVEKEGGVLVLRRIHVNYSLQISEDLMSDEVRDTVARVLKMHVDKCPVALSIKGAIDVTTDVEFV